MTTPNKPDAVNPAIASRLHAEHHWREVTDPDRSATPRMKALKLASLIAILCSLSGCTTTATIRAARGLPAKNDTRKPQPAFYLLFPLAVPVDFVATPMFYLLWAAHT